MNATVRVAAATVTINLKTAGLTHAAGKSDKCDGKHDVTMAAVTALDSPDWVPAAGLDAVFQAFHTQAHPDGTRYWENCRAAACVAAAAYLEEATSP